jgi:hypothetical protein
MLREHAKVTVVANVKPHLLHRIARMSGATVVPSVNLLDKVRADTSHTHLESTRPNRSVGVCARCCVM